MEYPGYWQPPISYGTHFGGRTRTARAEDVWRSSEYFTEHDGTRRWRTCGGVVELFGAEDAELRLATATIFRNTKKQH